MCMHVFVYEHVCVCLSCLGPHPWLSIGAYQSPDPLLILSLPGCDCSAAPCTPMDLWLASVWTHGDSYTEAGRGKRGEGQTERVRERERQINGRSVRTKRDKELVV